MNTFMEMGGDHGEKENDDRVVTTSQYLKYWVSGEKTKQNVYTDDISINSADAMMSYSSVSNFDQMSESIFGYLPLEDDL
mmetsp:Transcript_28698/g.43330  ORF Transcript_28698/g.43330 Transcript_28698/m.43330 type:complete len:80 (+) Transcript_28698:370-609(+)